MAERAMDGEGEGRRGLLQGALAALVVAWLGGGAAGCGPGAQAATPQRPLPPLKTEPLSGLVAAAGVRWVLFAAPRDLLGVVWIPPLVNVAVSGARFERFAAATGVDLRTLSDAVVVSYGPAGGAGGASGATGVVAPGATAASGVVHGAPGPAGGAGVVAPGATAASGVVHGAPGPAGGAGVVAPGATAASGVVHGAPGPVGAAASDDVVFYLAHHGGDATTIERSFRMRFTGSEKRSVDRPDLIRVSGKVGRETNVAVFLGREVAGFQDGGSVSRGPARVAALFAEGKLRDAHSVLAVEPLRSLAARLGAAPLAAYSPGPFEGDVARGLRGLLGAATALGAVVRPSARQGFLLSVAVAGDFTTSGGPAAKELLAAWNELATGGFGHMLGLDVPVEAPSVAFAPDAVMLTVELSGKTLAEGLAKATASRVEDIFR